jgi:cell division protein FtsB
MGEETLPGDTNGGGKKDRRRLLEILTPEPIAVPTSIGTLLARHVAVGDLGTFGPYIDGPQESSAASLKALGELAVKHLVSTQSTAGSSARITNEELGRLSDGDLRALAQEIANASELGLLADGDPLLALGTRLREDLKRQAALSAEMTRSIAANFSSVSESIRQALRTDLTQVEAIRNSLHLPRALDMLRAQDAWKSPTDALKEAAASPSDILRKQYEEMQATSGIFGRPRFSEPAQVITPPVLPDPSSFPMVRTAKAVEESAKQLQQVAALAARMTESVGSLTSTVVTKVLPEWFKSLKESADASRVTVDQAERNIKIATRAIIISILVSVGLTGWQLWVARVYKKDNDKQQDRVEDVLREQLKELKATNERLAADSLQMRKALERLESQRAAPAQQAVAPVNPASKPGNR